MRTNPGGRIAPEEAVGRGPLVERIWTILESQSIYMTAERRIGKTTVLDLLDTMPRANWMPAKRDLESCDTAREFAAAVYQQIHEFLGTKNRTLRRAKELFAHLGGTEVGGFLRLPKGKGAAWKTMLEKSFEDLHEEQERGSRILFLWDEIPFMIDNIRKGEGERTAMEVLCALRFAREKFPTVRMIMTGSIGLHHVLEVLKKADASEPINDMAAVEVPPLSAEDGRELAKRLLAGEGINCESREATAQALAAVTDNLPFYIHHLVRQLKFRCVQASPATVEEILREQMRNPNDPWQLRHYRTRIPTYYGNNEKAVLEILDSVAASHSGCQPLKRIHKEAGANVPGLDLEALRSILVLMERDHYLRRTEAGYSFTFPLIRRWWRMDRSL